MTTASHQRGEALQEALNFIDEQAQRWDERLQPKAWGFTKRYMEGDLDVLLLVKEKTVQADQFLVRYHRLGLTEFKDIADVAFSGDGVLYHSGVLRETYLSDDGAHGDDRSVLVDDIEVVDVHEQVFAVPSTVRLYAADCLEQLRPYVWHLGTDEGLKFGFVVGWLPLDWEAPVLNVSPADGSREVIERRAEIMNDVSKHKGNHRRDSGHVRGKVEGNYFGIRLSDQGIRVRLDEVIDFGLQVVEVFLGAAQLVPGSAQVGH